MWLLFDVALALDPAACDAGNATACGDLLLDATARLAVSASPEGALDPRYEPAVHHFAQMACLAGDRAACAWTSMGRSERPDASEQRSPPWLDDPRPTPPARRVYDLPTAYPVPVPGGGWTFLEGFEVGRQGVYLPGADQLTRAADALVASSRDSTDLVALRPSESRLVSLDVDEDACDTEVRAPVAMTWTADDCWVGPSFRLTVVDASIGRDITVAVPVRPRVLAVESGVVYLAPPPPAERGEALALDVATGTLTRTRVPDEAEWPLPDGRVVRLEERVLTIDGVPVFEEDGAPYRVVHHPDDGSVAVAYGGGTRLIGGSERTPEWMRRVHPPLPRPKGFGQPVVLQDEQGEPVAGAWLEGEVSDAGGGVRTSLVERGEPPTTRLGTLFVDGQPRQARLDNGLLTLLPLQPVPLPFERERLSPGDFGARLGPREVVLPSPLEAGALLYADANPEAPAQTADRVWRWDGGAWVELDATRIEVADEAGHLLAGLRVVTDDGQGPQQTDSFGRVRVWGDPEVTVVSIADEPRIAQRREARRIVLEGPPADPSGWAPSDLDVQGSWFGLDREGRPLQVVIQGRRRLPVSPPGLDGMGAMQWIVDGDTLLWWWDDTRLTRRKPVRSRNSKRWFTGTSDLRPGDSVHVVSEGPPGVDQRYDFGGDAGALTVEVVDPRLYVGGPPLDDGPVEFMVLDGLVMDYISATGGKAEAFSWTAQPQLERLWLLTGGPLHGTRLKRGVSETREVMVGGEQVQLIWRYEGREACGPVECARIHQQVDGQTMWLLIEPETLKARRVQRIPEGSGVLELNWE